MSDEGVPVPTLPRAPADYDERDQQDVRHLLQTFMTDVHESALRIIAQADADVAGITTGLVHLETQTPSAAASADFTSSIDSTYEEYLFVITHLIPATDNVDLWMRTSTDGGSTFDSGASDYSHASKFVTAAGAVSQITSVGDTEIEMTGPGVGSDTDEYGWSGRVYLVHPSDTAYTSTHFHGIYTSDIGRNTSIDGGGCRLAAEDVDAVQFLFSSGNIESGTIRLYGVDAG